MILSQKSDLLGSMASFLCLIHCILSPLLFVSQACSISCCSDTPVWWRAIDFFFLIISFWAVWSSTQKTSKQWLKYALWLSWFGVLVMILNETLALLTNIGHLFYVPAMTLIILHLYNKKCCNCSTKTQKCNNSTSQDLLLL